MEAHVILAAKGAGIGQGSRHGEAAQIGAGL